MGRALPDALAPIDEDERELLEASAQPDWVSPMLATLTDDRFSDPGWIFERKLDGERVMAWKDGESVRLMTRNRKEVSDTYPELAEALAAQSGEFILDGEVVAFEGSVTSFSRLQQRMQIRDPEKALNSGVRVFYYVFDIIWLGGFRLESLPLRSRKQVLRRQLVFDDPLRLASHRNEDGVALFKSACERGWEGLIAKDASSSYRHSRSRAWLKFKCSASQELVIGGFTAPSGSRKGFGALLVGYYEDDSLRYAGKVGTGFDDEFLERFRRRLDRRRRKTTPFADDVPNEDDVTWVTPDLVGEFAFTEWTRAGRLRHPRFLGLRRDKEAADVVRERPE